MICKWHFRMIIYLLQNSIPFSNIFDLFYFIDIYIVFLRSSYGIASLLFETAFSIAKVADAHCEVSLLSELFLAGGIHLGLVLAEDSLARILAKSLRLEHGINLVVRLIRLRIVHDHFITRGRHYISSVMSE